MNKKRILYASLFALLISSCSKNDVTEPSSPVESGKYKVSLSGAVSGQQVLTRGTTQLQGGVGVLAYAYAKGADVDAVALSPWTSTYVSNADNSGNLDLAGASDIYLPGGDYDFYACSPSSLLFALDANNKMVSGALSNGTDYLWATVGAKTIGTASNTVTLPFYHKAAKLHFNIVPDVAAGISTIVVDQAACKVTPTDVTGSFMYLKNGLIDQLKAVSATPVAMSADALNITDVEYIMLPLAEKTADGLATNKIELEFSVKVNGESTARLYKYSLTVPAASLVDPITAGGYEAGKVYNYTVSIKANKVVFTGCTVEDWTVTDLTGTPIVPTE